MANSIDLSSKFVPIIDDIYKEGSKSSILDNDVKSDFTNTPEIKILKVSTTGLGKYDRANGYPKGDVTAAWETMKLAVERGKELSVDRMDDEETLDLTFGTVVGQFERNHVVPEIDAYRFAKIAGTSSISTTDGAVLNKDTVIAAMDAAIASFDDNEVPQEDRYFFVSTKLKPEISAALNRIWGNDGTIRTIVDNYNDIPIIYVPSTRFYTAIDLNPGTESWGYKKTPGSGKDINFMLINKDAVVSAVKFVKPKIFDPDVNQDKDAWKFQFRLYHDIFVEENKVKGVYLHKSTT